MLPLVVDSIEGMDSAIVACCECALSFVLYSMVSQPIVAKLENEKNTLWSIKVKLTIVIILRWYQI